MKVFAAPTQDRCNAGNVDRAGRVVIPVVELYERSAFRIEVRVVARQEHSTLMYWKDWAPGSPRGLDLIEIGSIVGLV